MKVYIMANYQTLTPSLMSALFGEIERLSTQSNVAERETSAEQKHARLVVGTVDFQKLPPPMPPESRAASASHLSLAKSPSHTRNPLVGSLKFSNIGGK